MDIRVEPESKIPGHIPTGTPTKPNGAAADAPKKLASSEEAHPVLRKVAGSAIPELDEIQRFGLAEYDGTSNGSEGCVPKR